MSHEIMDNWKEELDVSALSCMNNFIALDAVRLPVMQHCPLITLHVLTPLMGDSHQQL